MEILKYRNGYICVSYLSENAIRIRAGSHDRFSENNPCVRYGIYDMSESTCKDKSLQCSINGGVLYVNGMKTAISFHKGFEYSVTVDEEEKFYGLGDADRSTLEKRGTEHLIWVENVKCYIPFPVLLSSKGWGIFSSTTYKQKFDICKKDRDTVSVYANNGPCDIVIFTGKGYKGLLKEFRRITGFAKLMPKYAYGLSYVANQKIDAFNMINEMYTLRKEGIPCDVYGLEPEWMEHRYDATVDKKMNPVKFYIPYWMDMNCMHDNTFFRPIREMNYKLSLWLCCNYDLSYEEERNAVMPKADTADDMDDGNTEYLKDRVWDDPNFSTPQWMDKLTIKDQPWFEHLKKFVDMGASAFKLDGAWQIDMHPDRLYGNGMNDDEMHNLYPLIYAKQMSSGFEDHTKRRSLVYSSGGFAGIQQYVATWAGDTGGGPKPLVSMLNLAMSGHVNTTCDMDTHNEKGIHFGFLQPWSQQCNWDYWNQPWLFDQKLKDTYIYYDRLRYSLLPYLYSAAYEAYIDVTPIMRPLIYDWPNDKKAVNILNEYMLGRYLLVASFIDGKIYLPKGTWIDMFTNEEYTGGKYYNYIIPVGKGGALFILKGAILPKVYGLLSVPQEAFSEYTLECYPNEKKTSFTIYEDDGISLEYKDGRRTEAHITCQKKGDSVWITISRRKGDFDGKPKDVRYDIRIITNDTIENVTVNGIVCDFTYENGAVALGITENEMYKR